MSEEILQICMQAKAAAHAFALVNSDEKNAALDRMAVELEKSNVAILESNGLDLEIGASAGLSAAMLDRLSISEERFCAMVQGLRDLVKLEDPVGQEISRKQRPNGLDIAKVRVPIGVIGIIYESRPNVTADAAGLCVKTSNAVILRGGKEAMHSNRAIAKALIAGADAAGLPKDTVQLVQTSDRAAVKQLVQMEEYIDVIIPRGGEGLIRAVSEMSRVPVLKHYKGVCHVYIDKSADAQMAESIIVNAKCQRPGVCNAAETLLVHREVASHMLPNIAAALTTHGVELRGDTTARSLVEGITAADESDWGAEYLALILAVRVVDSIEEAIRHINRYGSRHTDAIVATDAAAQEAFAAQVDSAVVAINASTRFNDGAEFGLGAEMGISTDKLHARGPVGPEELTTYKYVLRGEGQIRS